MLIRQDVFARDQVQLQLDYAAVHATITFVSQGIGSTDDNEGVRARDQATELLRQLARTIEADFSSGRISWAGGI